MTKQRTIRRMLLAMALAALGANGTALAEPGFADNFTGTELEGGPQLLQFDSEGMAQVWGRISNDWGVDVDYYSFEANAGDVVTLDIDGGMPDGLDSVLYVFDPAGKRRYGGDDATRDTDPADPGSSFTKSATATFDSYVKFTADMAGTWKVAVVAEPAVVNDNGSWVRQEAWTGGQYNLFVSRSKPAAPEYMAIDIDIKPNNPHNATPIKMGQRHIRVALLSGSGFDPFAIEVASLRFGPTGNEESLVRCAKRGKDRNGDRKRDRVCRFDNAKAGFTLANTVGIVKGTTRDGKAFQGSADVKVLARKYHKDRRHHDDDDDDDDD